LTGPAAPPRRPGPPAPSPRAAAPLRIRAFLMAPSPHTLGFFHALSGLPGVELHVVFCHASLWNKPWGQDVGTLRHTVLDWGAKGLAGQVRALREAAREPADVWIFGESVWAWNNALLNRLVRRRGARTVFIGEPICWTGLGFERPGLVRSTLMPRTKRLLARRVLGAYDALAAMGAWGVEHYRELVPGRTVFPTAYAVEMDALRALPREPRDGTLRIGFCGQLIHRKGILPFVEALGRELGGVPGWELLIAGEGPLRGELEARAAALGIAGRVRMLGFLPQERLRRELWSRIDLLAFPSLFDGWGMAVVEALAAGVPVLSAPDVGAAREHVVDGRNGWIAALDDFPARIAALLAEPDALSGLSARARASAAGLTPERVARDFVRHLAEVA
jgi:glycosyltransferase involved in cell wall biosynthesis